MKKTLVALAALAATASFAQSAVTISGVWDAGWKNTNAQDTTASKAEFAGNNQGTSRIIVSGVEDLGGGLKAEFKGQGLINAVSGQTGNSASPYQQGSQLFNDEIWLGMSGGFGSFKIGTPDSVMHVQAARSQPFGTNMGSGWASSGVSRFKAGTATDLGLNQFVGGASANGRIVRAEKSVRYDSPNLNGFALQINYAAKNDNASAGSTSNTNGVTEYAISYSNGPLNAAYAISTITAGAFAAAGNNSTLSTSAVVNNMPANSQAVYTFAAANYTMGAATVYVGATTAKTDGVTTGALDTTSTNVAVKYALSPMIDLQGNVVSIKDKTAAAKDQFLNAVGAYYKFSKRTTTYFVLENYNTDQTASNKGVNTYALGVMHTF